MRLGIRDHGMRGRGLVKDDPDSIRPWETWMPSLPYSPLQAPPGYEGGFMSLDSPSIRKASDGIRRAWAMGHQLGKQTRGKWTRFLATDTRGGEVNVHVFRPFPHPSSFPIYPFPGLQDTKFLKAPNSHPHQPWRPLLTLPLSFPKALELFLTSKTPSLFLCPHSYQIQIQDGQSPPGTEAENVGTLCLGSLIPPRDPPSTSPL